MRDGIDGYVPREYAIPSFEEVFATFGLSEKEQWYSREGIDRLNRRKLRWLYQAALCAHATLNVVIAFYPQKDRWHLEPILNDLISPLEVMRKHFLDDARAGVDMDALIRDAEAAVAHAGNVFNNTCHILPENVIRAILEARDVCDEAVRQPKLIAG
ncbi:MAG: hypothetical protein Q8Q39_02515 [bacterium]|nr:hypothetical protein [bacterium]